MGRAITNALANRPDVAVAEDAPDVYIDFSAPDALEKHLGKALAVQKPIVIGPTGLTPEHQRMIDDAATKIAVLQAANNSLGANLLPHLVRETAARLGEEWDIEIGEMHHRTQKDGAAGSGPPLGGAVGGQQGSAEG